VAARSLKVLLTTKLGVGGLVIPLTRLGSNRGAIREDTNDYLYFLGMDSCMATASIQGRDDERG